MRMLPEKKHRIVIVDDHTILRDGLRALLSSRPDLEVVGEAVDGREGVRVAEDLQPDLLLLDLNMPKANGLEALKEIRRVSPGTKVLILTVQKGEDYIFEGLQSGADGYALKDSSSAELFHAVRSVLAGERYLSPAIATTVVARYVGGKDQPALHNPFGDLSVREREVLKLLAEGHRSREIAEFLCISPKTVEKHRANLMEKLNLHSIPALTAYAIDRGMVSN